MSSNAKMDRLLLHKTLVKQRQQHQQRQAERSQQEQQQQQQRIEQALAPAQPPQQPSLYPPQHQQQPPPIDPETLEEEESFHSANEDEEEEKEDQHKPAAPAAPVNHDDFDFEEEEDKENESAPSAYDGDTVGTHPTKVVQKKGVFHEDVVFPLPREVAVQKKNDLEDSLSEDDAPSPQSNKTKRETSSLSEVDAPSLQSDKTKTKTKATSSGANTFGSVPVPSVADKRAGPASMLHHGHMLKPAPPSLPSTQQENQQPSLADQEFTLPDSARV